MATAVQIGALDTSVIIDLDHLSESGLPHVATVPSVVLAELSAGVHAAQDAVERAARMDRLHRVSLLFESLPFDEAASQQYALLVAHVIDAGRNPRPRRFDLLIAATAAANRLPLYTRNPKDFIGLENALTVIAVLSGHPNTNRRVRPGGGSRRGEAALVRLLSSWPSGTLRADRDPRRAADVYVAVVSVDGYTELTHERGWRPEAIRELWSGILTRELLA